MNLSVTINVTKSLKKSCKCEMVSYALMQFLEGETL